MNKEDPNPLKNHRNALLNLTMDYMSKNSYLVGFKRKITVHRKNNFLL